MPCTGLQEEVAAWDSGRGLVGPEQTFVVDVMPFARESCLKGHHPALMSGLNKL